LLVEDGPRRRWEGRSKCEQRRDDEGVPEETRIVLVFHSVVEQLALLDVLLRVPSSFARQSTFQPCREIECVLPRRVVEVPIADDLANSRTGMLNGFCSPSEGSGGGRRFERVGRGVGEGGLGVVEGRGEAEEVGSDDLGDGFSAYAVERALEVGNWGRGGDHDEERI
jgi:hypothetical protein